MSKRGAIFNKWWRGEGLISLLGALPLLWIAVYNGFPLVDYDAGTYIGSGFSFSFPLDRPIFYGLFIALTSAGVSLWGTLLAQAWLTSLAIFKLLGLIDGSEEVNSTSRFQFVRQLIVIGLLAILTPISWYVSTVMADVFTPLLVIGVAGLILAGKNQGYAFWRGLTFASALMHGSHYLILGSIFGLIFLGELAASKFSWGQLRRLKVWRVGAVLGVAILMLSTANLKNQVFTPSPASHIFLLGRLTETGLLERHLTIACQKESNNSGPLCEHLDHFPKTLSDFIWSSEMPHAKQGWMNVKDYYRAVGTQIVKEEPISFLQAGIAEFWQHLTHLSSFAVPMPEEHPASKVIKERFPTAFSAFQSGRQQQVQMQGREWDTTYNYGYALSAIIIAAALKFAIKRKKVIKSNNLIACSLLLLAGFLSNLAVVGVLIGNDIRLGCRAHWQVPFVALILVTSLVQRSTMPKAIAEEK